MSDVVQRARELLAGITRGPWQWNDYRLPDLMGRAGDPDIYEYDVEVLEASHSGECGCRSSCELELTISDADKAFIAAAPQLVADLADEVERLRRGGRTLGKIIDDSLIDVLKATDSFDLVGDDLDGDWMAVFERLAELRPARDAARAEVERLRAEQREFASRLEFGDGVTEPAATLADMLDPIREAFSEARDHQECPRLCEQCGDTLAATLCPDCHGSGCNGTMSAAAGAYAECEHCGGSGWIHEGCADATYADLATAVERLQTERRALIQTLTARASEVEDRMLAAGTAAETSRHANELAGVQFAINELERLEADRD